MTHLDQVERIIVKLPDFHSKGILFLDIFPLYKNSSSIKALLEEFQRPITPSLGVINFCSLYLKLTELLELEN
jgi:adenine/guanine phosphoribosyltransferase-like PRPP-binding protein